MTQGIVSIRLNGQMVYKIITGHDGMHAPEVGTRIRDYYRHHGKLPDADAVRDIAHRCGFGCRECLIILEADPKHYNEPRIHLTNIDWDEEGKARYLDTFNVAQFNPRWKFGTADYVEVIDL